jgi:predicted nucleotidyltransferase
MTLVTQSPAEISHGIDNILRDVLSQFPDLELAILFGSVACDRARIDSDLDIAVSGKKLLGVDEHVQIISALANATGRPIDLIDLKVVGVPLLGQILKYGRRLFGSDTLYGQLISRNLFDQADFMPYHNRILTERRLKWIGK